MTPTETLTLLDAVSMPVLNGAGTVPGSVDALIADATLMIQASPDARFVLAEEHSANARHDPA